MSKTRPDLLSRLRIRPSPRSRDYVSCKRQFQLHSLLTEQRHPVTWNLSFLTKRDMRTGLSRILEVDEDISARFLRFEADPAPLEQAADTVRLAISEGRRIFIYGCGSTGRLAKQMESALWRPFWKRFRSSPLGTRLRPELAEKMGERLIGEMTGGDRAMVSALEGFEDLPLVGELQLRERGFVPGDPVFAITEGGETSSVIGAVTSAAELSKDSGGSEAEELARRLYFIYNNPDDVLRPFLRSRAVLEDSSYTRINLTTGPQAIAGSTRMQAATSETCVMGFILESGIRRFLLEHFTEEELARVGFGETTGSEALRRDFGVLRESLTGALDDLARLSDLEAQTDREERRVVYFADRALAVVFIDCAERSPTFHLHPLDTVLEDPPQSRLQVWTAADDGRQAWEKLLGRPYRGLDASFFRPAFESRIKDPYLREAALGSLARAGPDQEGLYDFALSPENLAKRGPGPGDLAVVVALDGEIDTLTEPGSPFFRFLRFCRSRGAVTALILAGEPDARGMEAGVSRINRESAPEVVVPLPLAKADDPLGWRRHTLLKIMLNAHSTAVMARNGRVVGNTMTHVKPSNLKLVGRATHLIQGHVNDALTDPAWIAGHGAREPVSYTEANAVLFSAMDFKAAASGEAGEVELSILRILDELRTGEDAGWPGALRLSRDPGLEGYLSRHHPAVMSRSGDLETR